MDTVKKAVRLQQQAARKRLLATDVPKRALSKSRKGFLFWGYFWVFRHFQNSKTNVSH